MRRTFEKKLNLGQSMKLVATCNSARMGLKSISMLVSALATFGCSSPQKTEFQTSVQFLTSSRSIAVDGPKYAWICSGKHLSGRQLFTYGLLTIVSLPPAKQEPKLNTVAIFTDGSDCAFHLQTFISPDKYIDQTLFLSSPDAGQVPFNSSYSHLETVLLSKCNDKLDGSSIRLTKDECVEVLAGKNIPIVFEMGLRRLGVASDRSPDILFLTEDNAIILHRSPIQAGTSQ